MLMERQKFIFFSGAVVGSSNKTHPAKSTAYKTKTVEERGKNFSSSHRQKSRYAILREKKKMKKLTSSSNKKSPIPCAILSSFRTFCKHRYKLKFSPITFSTFARYSVLLCCVYRVCVVCIRFISDYLLHIHICNCLHAEACVHRQRVSVPPSSFF